MSFLFSQPRKVVKTSYHLRGNLDFCLTYHLSPIYLPSPRPIPSPVYGIISRCPMYRIRVASDSAGSLISFQLILEFIWSVSEIQQLIEKFLRIWPGCRIEPAPFFYPGFASEELLFQMRTQVFSYKIKSSLKWGSNPRPSRSSSPWTSRSSSPRTPQSSVQEGHDTFRVMNYLLHEMIKPFQDLETPIRISAFSSPALLN